MTQRNRRRFGLIVGVSLVYLLAAPGIGNAQQISGAVTDSTGGVLPGVTVEARSPSIIEQVRTAVTDANGQYTIIALESGTYAVTYSLPGFGSIVREGIELSIGFTASIDIELSVGDIQETVTVSGASPVVDIQGVQQRAVMDREIIDSIPSGKSISSYGLLVPGMVGAEAFGSSLQQDAGGLSAQIMQRMTIHGGAAEDQMVNINGMDVAEPHTQGGDMGFFPAENFEEMAFSYAGNSAEHETGGVSINMIPKEGGNSFSGSLFTTFARPGWMADNLDQDLIDRGLESGSALVKNWSISPSFGGPIVEDRVWFFLTHTSRVADLQAAGVFYAADPRAVVYAPDLSRPAVDETTAREQSLNLTVQATSKDKLKAYWTNSSTDRPHYLQGRAISGLFITPEASVNNLVRTNAYQVNWTRPHTNRLLFEAGVSHMPMGYDLGHALDAELGVPGVFEVAPVQVSRNSSSWLSGTDEYFSPKNTNFYRASMSFVTGSHNLKVGVGFNQQRTSTNGNSEFWTRLWTIFGNPFRATFYGGLSQKDTASSLGIYAQEQWTIDRLTVNAGVRFDSIRTGYPDQERATNIYVPDPFLVEGQTVASWKDFQPRLGLAYDLRGDGKTALKASLSRYGARDSTDLSQSVNPAVSSRSMNRTWIDSLCIPTASDPTGSTCIAGDGLVQGDPRNNAPNGELISANTNLAFGLPAITTFHDENWAFGWGNRRSNWEFSGSIQQELMPGVSLDVAYYRRAYINFSTQDNRAVGPDDYEIGTVTVPTNPLLPDGGGGTLSFVDIRPGSVRVADNLTVHADDFGGDSETWNGVDFTVDARLNNVLLSGGVSTGRRSRDFCDRWSQLPETVGEGALDHCNRSENWLTQVKLLGSFTFPYDIQVAATLQNQPGPVRAATLNFASADTSLGRPLSQNSIELNLIEPGSFYGERFTQFDLRFTKILDLGGSGVRLRAMFDLFNVFNANTVMAETASFDNPATWLTPEVIMPGRLAKLAFQLNF